MKKLKISPSILSADFGILNEEIATIEPYADYLHIDVMDGHFVPNITFGAPVIRCIKTCLPLDIHLMIEHPERYIEDFVSAALVAGSPKGEMIITVQAEACVHLDRVIHQIKEAGAKASVALNPASPLEMIEYVLYDLDQVLLMTVNPGFCGQKFIENVVPKIKKLRKMAPELDIEVDGGINDKTVQMVVDAGANVLVAGSYVFGAGDRVMAIKSLRVA